MIDLSDLSKNWKSPYVAREKLSEFTGGILNPRTIANLDAKKIGIEGRIKIGRKVAYPVDSIIRFLESRAVEL